MKEILTKERAVIATALTLALGVTACGSSEKTKDSAKPPAQLQIAANSGVSVRKTTFANGTRLIRLTGAVDQHSNVGNYPVDIFEFCDGNDLVEETLNYEYGDYPVIAGGSVSRSVDYTGCVDGKLTPSDFAKPVEGISPAVVAK